MQIYPPKNANISYAAKGRFVQGRQVYSNLSDARAREPAFTSPTLSKDFTEGVNSTVKVIKRAAYG